MGSKAQMRSAIYAEGMTAGLFYDALEARSGPVGLARVMGALARWEQDGTDGAWEAFITTLVAEAGEDAAYVLVGRWLDAPQAG